MNIVHIKALNIMNTVVTSREDILKASRTLVQEGTAEGISIRSVAAACGVSVGSIYNYFQSKTDLVAATVESIWADIFHTPAEDRVLCSLELYISWLFQRFQYGDKMYPGFFGLHALSFSEKEKKAGRQRMENLWHHIEMGLLQVIRKDKDIREAVFSETFTPKDFAHLIFMYMISSLVLRDYDCSKLLESIRRIVS